MQKETQKTVCNIQIKCLEPCENGQIQVEMTCEGDDALVSYVLEHACSTFNKRKSSNNAKIYS